MSWLQHLWWWIEVHTGTVNESGPYYGFWSGFGSDLGELAILGGIVQVYRHHKCATCLRIGVHKLETGEKTCHKHTTHEVHDALRLRHRLKYPHHIIHIQQEKP